jgi:glycosyltransferase involved in cell wall biosynthesis
MAALTLFIIFSATIAYAYAGYPLLLIALMRGRKEPPPPPDLPDDRLPTVALLIAAHDEEAALAEKLENSLRIDYPRSKLRIVVVSDGSTDRTDEIARRYAPKGVALIRVEPRGGKSIARNRAVAEETSEILVMSDANAMYEPSAVRKLVRHFVDPSVGVVCGELRLVREHGGENLYWRYEKWIKRLENRFHAIVSANGSIYAMRRSLYFPLPPQVDDDFVEPLNALCRGRAVRYEAEAVSVEPDIKPRNIAREYSAKRRTVLRGMQSLLYMCRVARPFRQPVVALELVSHKIFKWLVPFLLLGILVTTALLHRYHDIFLVLLAGQIFLYGCAIAGILTGRRIFYVPAFFVVANAGVFSAVIALLSGKQSKVWERHRG